jgi:hypothetical protein
MQKLFIASQYLAPQHLLSRCVGHLAASETPWLKNMFINWFVRRYNVDMSEAANPDLASYASFNAVFTRALREALPDRRRRIGAAIGASGLANEAIRNLTGESRDKTYDAFSLLFLMSKAGEVQPLMRAIEEHPSTEARLAVVKLLALSGQPEVLPAFRRMAVRGSLPADVRSAVMEAIYHITSQSPTDAASSV